MDSIKIENFGPIKKADIQLGKLTVLIGEPASGKSTVAKLVGAMNSKDLFFENSHSILKKLSIESYLSEGSSISYSCPFYSSNLSSEEVTFDFHESHLQKLADHLTELYRERSSFKKSIQKALSGKGDDKLELMLKMQEQYEFKYFWYWGQLSVYLAAPFYFPTERTLVLTLANLTFSLNQERISLPQQINTFGLLFEEARNAIKDYESNVIKFQYKNSRGKTKIVINGIETSLSEGASGIQTLIPLELVVEYLTSNGVSEKFSSFGKRIFIIEEPELSLYPIQQKRLLEYLVSKSIQHGDKLIITTHSPYILTAINNLIEADNVIKKRPELKEEVNKLIPEHLQLAFEDVTAYFMNADGTSHSIMDEETRMIDAKAIDVASDEIVGVFDQLLNLEYQK